MAWLNTVVKRLGRFGELRAGVGESVHSSGAAGWSMHNWIFLVSFCFIGFTRLLTR